MRLVPIALRLLHVGPCEERAPVLPVAALHVLEYHDEVPLSHLFSRVVGGGHKAGCSSIGLGLLCAEIVAIVYW